MTHSARKTAAAAVLDTLRWREDMAITNYDGERVWLGPCFNEAGEQIGITDCCLVDDPCEHHAAIANASYTGGDEG